MRITFDNLDGNGVVDYSACVCADGALTLKIERVLNAPSRCSGMLLLMQAEGPPVPVRRARIVVTAENGTLLFTGYVATEQQQIYAGSGTQGPVYRTAFSAVSDEWLLDKQSIPAAGAGFQQLSGAVLTALTNRTQTGLFATGGVAAGRRVGVFVPGETATWSANAGSAAASAYAAYRVIGGALSLQPVGAVTHALSDGDGTLQLGALQLAAIKELANDVTVSGATEPAAYIRELFMGDGTTAAFQLAETPFHPKPFGTGSRLLSDSFDQGVFKPRVWGVSDSGSHLGLTSLGLTMRGGNGLDGQTTLTALDAVEMGGTLLIEAGSLRLNAASDGLVCGLYSGAVTRANCFAGYNVRQSGGVTLATPWVNGAEVGTPLTILQGHAYTLRMRLHCVETQRVRQIYYAMVDGVVTNFGGGVVEAPMAVVFEWQDLDVSSNTPATLLYEGVVPSSPASCTFAAVNSIQLFGSMGYCRVTQTGSAWITSTLPSGVASTRLIGIAGEGVDCMMNSTGLVTFLAGRIPLPGEIVTVAYRGSRRSVARLQDSASVAAETEGGAPGSAAWLGKVLRPPARCSEDCESAALAILSFASSRAAAIAGHYEAVNPDDVWPGDLLTLTRGGQETTVLVRRVSIVDGMAAPELLTYRIEFANDWAESLGLTLSEAIAEDALLPEAASAAPSNVLANLQQLQVVSANETALQVDAGMAPPAGGGFEVRRRDWDFGPQVDQDLVLRSPERSFSIPREGQVERYYVRMYDGATPPLYSRFSSAVYTRLAVD
ncbi:hypothetical protein BH10ACI4_BH10ACI4_36400 [soil metagenome]